MKIGGKFQSIFAGKKRVFKFIVIAAVVPLGVMLAILSFESYNTSQTSAQISANDQQFQTRINKYKQDLTDELTSERRQLIVDKCEGSQTRIGQLSTKQKKVKLERESRSTRLSEKLASVSEKLQDEDLETLVADLDTQTNTFNTNVAVFNTTLGDLLEVNCVTDPLGYASALAVARTQLKDLKTEASSIRSKVQEIRAKLEQIKAGLR